MMKPPSSTREAALEEEEEADEGISDAPPPAELFACRIDDVCRASFADETDEEEAEEEEDDVGVCVIEPLPPLLTMCATVTALLLPTLPPWLCCNLEEGEGALPAPLTPSLAAVVAERGGGAVAAVPPTLFALVAFPPTPPARVFLSALRVAPTLSDTVGLLLAITAGV